MPCFEPIGAAPPAARAIACFGAPWVPPRGYIMRECGRHPGRPRGEQQTQTQRPPLPSNPSTPSTLTDVTPIFFPTPITVTPPVTFPAPRSLIGLRGQLTPFTSTLRAARVWVVPHMW